MANRYVYLLVSKYGAIAAYSNLKSAEESLVFHILKSEGDEYKIQKLLILP